MEKETIHSGHFMVSEIDDSEVHVDDDASILTAHESDGDQDNVPLQNEVRDFDFDKGCKETWKTYTYGPRSSHSISIDVSLTKLFETMSLAFSGRLTSPRWKTFKGLKLSLKNKIRLNNIIWRAWHIQFLGKRKPVVCQFASPLDGETHNKPEAAMEAMDLDVRWPSRAWEGSACMSSVMDDEFLMDTFSDTLFSSLIPNQPFDFPNPREIAAKAGNADFIQPGLIQLQPSLDDIYMDTFEPLSDFLMFRLPPLPEEVSEQVHSQETTTNSGGTEQSQNLQGCPSEASVSSGNERNTFGSSSAASSMCFSQDLPLFSSEKRFLSSKQPVASSQSVMLDSFLMSQEPQLISTTSAERDVLMDSPETAQQNNQTVSDKTFGAKAKSSISSSSISAFIDSKHCGDLFSVSPSIMSTPMTLQSSSTKVPSLAQAHTTSGFSRPFLSPSIGHQKVSPQNFITCSSSEYSSSAYSQSQSIITQNQLDDVLSKASKIKPKNIIVKVEEEGRISNGTAQVSQDSGVFQRRHSFTGTRISWDKPIHRDAGQSVNRTTTQPGNKFVIPISPLQRPERSRSISSPQTGSPRLFPQLSTHATSLTNINVSPPPSLSTMSRKRSPDTTSNRKLLPAVTSTSALTHNVLAQLLTSPRKLDTISTLPTTVTSAFSHHNPASLPVTIIGTGPAGGPSGPQTFVLSPLTLATVTGMNDLGQNLLVGTTQVLSNHQKVPLLSVSSNSLNNNTLPAALEAQNIVAEKRISSPSKPLRPKSDEKQLKYKEHRRVSHINAEQKRRCNIKNGFDALRHLLPSLSQNPNCKVSKAAMLQKAGDYIRTMKAERQQQQEEAELLREQIGGLNKTISMYQNQLPATGAPMPCQRANKMTEMFRDYVRQRTLENWKFWIFSMIMESLLDSYNNSLSTANLDEMCKTVLTWLEQHCTLTSLRPVVLNCLRHLSTSTSILSDVSLLPEEATAAVTKKEFSNQ
ncbi:MLX-interacting protein-like isoform X2 [Tachypleus tridentatus]|uniref:MLX-interacting protein-like isoform X2 n=1 Tax=Tachypleus tridentatus TaxID=6853 RepID=UPI003FD494F4